MVFRVEITSGKVLSPFAAAFDSALTLKDFLTSLIPP